MSSIVDSNLILSEIENQKNITVSMYLENGNSRLVDLTNDGANGVFNHLDFQPDYVELKYIAYSSSCNANDNAVPILRCNFTNSDILAPFLATPNIQNYNLKFKCNWNKTDIRHVTFTHTGLIDNIVQEALPTGTICIGLEFTKYINILE